jgi:hypothetical protein
MIKKFLILISVLTGYSVFAQDDIDAMRYSQTGFYGDARFTAMAGSFGALGANLSCMNFNPAGIAMYRNGEFVFTPGVKFQSVNTSHYDNTAGDFVSKVNISNIGFVSAWNSKNNYPPSSRQYTDFNQRNAFGISYNRMADFNTNVTIQGYPSNSSIVNDFVNAAQGYGPASLNPTYEWLAYQSGVIYNVNDTLHYKGDITTAPHPNPLAQTKTIKTSGRMGELAFSFAHAFNDQFYLGATMGVPSVKYTRQSTYTESDYKSTIPYFRSLEYNEQLVTSGTGINLKIGGIYRINENLRVGAYVHTPTRINLTDNYQYSMNTTFDNYVYVPFQNDTALTGSANTSGYFKYRVTTPARAGASVCYIYKKLLAVNADAEFVNYASAKMKDAGNYLNGVNLIIAQKYKSTLNLRIGAELNIRPVVIRVGYASYGSPFGQVLTGKFVRNTLSGGVGFRGPRNVYIDLGLMYTQWSEDYYVYSARFVNPTQITNSVVYFTATLGIKFN